MHEKSKGENTCFVAVPAACIALTNDSQGPADRKIKALKDGVPKGLLLESTPADGTSKQVYIFFHPDYTVGTGVSPVQFGPLGAQSRGLYRRSGITPRPENLIKQYPNPAHLSMGGMNNALQNAG
jgi:hypothetical protein